MKRRIYGKIHSMPAVRKLKCNSSVRKVGISESKVKDMKPEEREKEKRKIINVVMRMMMIMMIM
jgi:hypothetical protein